MGFKQWFYGLFIKSKPKDADFDSIVSTINGETSGDGRQKGLQGTRLERKAD